MSMNQQVYTPEQLASFVDSLLIPVSGTTLLLPVSAVSEVIDEIELQPLDSNDKSWMYGVTQWREKEIKVLSYEALSGVESPAIDEHSRLAIFKAAGEESDFEFYGVVTQGYPRSVRVTPTSDFRSQGNQPEESGVLMYATLDDQSVVIPDLAYIEQLLG